MKATLHFENPYKSMSMDMDNSILNCSLMDVSHHPIRAEEPAHTECINGVSESALLENIQSINMVLNHSESVPTEDFVKGFISSILESPIITKKNQLVNFTEKLNDLEEMLKDFNKPKLMKKKTLNKPKNIILEGIKEVESEEEDKNEREEGERQEEIKVEEKNTEETGEETIEEGNEEEKNDLNRAFVVEELDQSNGSLKNLDNSGLMGVMSPIIGNSILKAMKMKQEDFFDEFDQRYTQLKKIFRNCKKMEKENSVVKESIEELATALTHFSLNSNLDLASHILKYCRELKNNETKILDIEVLEYTKKGLEKLKKEVTQKKENPERQSEFGGISQILTDKSHFDVSCDDISNQRVLSELNCSTPDVKKMVVMKKHDEKDSQLLKESQNFADITTSAIKNLNNSTDANVFDDRKKSLEMAFNFLPIENENKSDKEKEEEKKVGNMVDELCNSGIIKMSNSMMVNKNDESLDYSRILSNSVLLDGESYKPRINPLNESMATMGNSNVNNMRVFNYFWTPRYLRTGVSSFPFDKGDTADSDNCNEKEKQ